MKSRRLRFIVGLLLLAVLIAVGMHRIVFSRLGALLHASPYGIVALATVYLATRMFNGEILRLSARSLDVEISQSEGFLIMMVMSYTNLFIPRAGLGAPALYLKHRYNLKFTEFTSFLLPMTVMQLACFGIVGVAAQLAILRLHALPVHTGLAVFFCCLTAANAAILFVPLKALTSLRGRVFDLLGRFSSAWETLRRDRAMIARIVLIQLIVIFLRALRLQLAYFSIGRSVSFPGALIVSIMAQLGMFVSLTPGAFGFREAAMIYGSCLIGDSAGTGAAVALLDRAVITACVVVAGQSALWFGLKGRESGTGPA